MQHTFIQKVFDKNAFINDIICELLFDCSTGQSQEEQIYIKNLDEVFQLKIHFRYIFERDLKE